MELHNRPFNPRTSKRLIPDEPQGIAKKNFRWRRPRHTLKERQTASEVDRIGLRLQLRKRQAEAGDIVLLLRR